MSFSEAKLGIGQTVTIYKKFECTFYIIQNPTITLTLYLFVVGDINEGAIVAGANFRSPVKHILKHGINKYKNMFHRVKRVFEI